MNNLLKGAEQLGNNAVSSVGNLIGGATNAIEGAFSPKPISTPLPQQIPVQSQPGVIQGLLSSLPQETMGALNMVQNMFNQGEQSASNSIGNLLNNTKPIEQNVSNVALNVSQLAQSAFNSMQQNSLAHSVISTGESMVNPLAPTVQSLVQNPLFRNTAINTSKDIAANFYNPIANSINNLEQENQNVVNNNPPATGNFGQAFSNALQDTGNLARNTILNPSFLAQPIKAVGYAVAPESAAFGGLFSGGATVVNNITHNQPIDQNLASSFARGTDFGATLGPLGMVAEMVPGISTVGQIASKIAPEGSLLSQGASNIAKSATENFLAGTGYGFTQGQNPLQALLTGATFIPYGAFGVFGKNVGMNDTDINDIVQNGKALGLKGINPRAFNMHPDDIADAEGAFDALKSGNQAVKNDAYKTIQNLLDAYAPGYEASSTKKAVKAIQYLIDVNDKISPELRAKLPKMDLVGNENQNTIQNQINSGGRPISSSDMFSQVPGAEARLARSSESTPIIPQNTNDVKSVQDFLSGKTKDIRSEQIMSGENNPPAKAYDVKNLASEAKNYKSAEDFLMAKSHLIENPQSIPITKEYENWLNEKANLENEADKIDQQMQNLQNKYKGYTRENATAGLLKSEPKDIKLLNELNTQRQKILNKANLFSSPETPIRTLGGPKAVEQQLLDIWNQANNTGKHQISGIYDELKSRATENSPKVKLKLKNNSTKGAYTNTNADTIASKYLDTSEPFPWANNGANPPHPSPLESNEQKVNEVLKGTKYKIDNGMTIPRYPGRENPIQVTNPGATVRDARALMDTAKTQIEERGNVVEQLVKQGVDTSGKPEGGESPTNFGENKLFRQAIEHPDQEANILEQVNNPDKFKTALNAFRQFTNDTYNMAKNSGSKIQYLKNYYSHILDLSDPLEKERYDEFVDAKAKNFKGWFNKSRVFSNIEELEKNGFHLKNANVADDVSDYTKAFSKEQGARVLSNELVKNFPGQATLVDGEGAPINSIQSRIPGTKGLYLSQDLHKQLADLEPAMEGKFIKVLNTANTLDKEARLGGGLFHVQNTGWDYLGSNLGLGRFPRVLTAVRVFLSPSSYTDYMKDAIDDGTLDKMAKSNITFGTKQDFNSSFVNKIPGISQLNTATFGRLMNFFKVEAFRALDNKGFIDVSTPEGIKTAQGYGREINNMFGGQNRIVGDDIFNKNSTTKFIAHNLLALAPDYQQGRFKRTFSAFGLGNGGGINPLNRTPANNYAAYTLLTRTILTAVVAEALRRAVTGKFNSNLINVVKNDIFDPNFPTPWQNTSASGNKTNEIAHLSSTNLSDIYKLMQDPTHFLVSHQPALLGDYTSFQANQNYFGDKLSQSNNSIEKLLKVGQNDLPIPVVQTMKLFGGKEAPGNALLNELGARVSLSPTDPTSIYFNNLNKVQSTLTPNQLSALNYLMTSSKNGGLTQAGDAQILLKNWSSLYPALKQVDTGEQVHNPIFQGTEAQAKAYYSFLTMNPQQQAEYAQQHPEVLDQVKSMQSYWSQIATSQGKQPYASNPILSFPNKTIANYMTYEVLNKTAPGSAEEKQYLKNHPEVLPVIQAVSQNYNSQSGGIVPISSISSMLQQPQMAFPSASPYVQQQLNSNAPNYNDPQVQQYLSNHLEYVNQERGLRGLSPIDQYGNIAGSKYYTGPSTLSQATGGMMGGATYPTKLGSPSTSQSSGFGRNLRREFTYEKKSFQTKLSKLLEHSNMPNVVAAKLPKMPHMSSSSPVKHSISLSPKKGHSYKSHTVASLLSTRRIPHFQKLPLPRGGKIKRVFI